MEKVVSGDLDQIKAREWLEAGYVVDMPLSDEGSWLRIGMFDKEKNEVRIVPVYIPFGQLIVRHNTLPHSGNYGSPGNTRIHCVLKLPGKKKTNTSLLGYVRLFNGEECGELRRGKNEGWKVRWDKDALKPGEEAWKPGEWGTGSEKTSGGMVAKELRAVNEGSMEMTIALKLLSPSVGGKKTKKDEAEDDDEEKEDGKVKGKGGGGKRKAKGEAKGSSKKKAKKGGAAAEGGGGGGLDEKEMKRMLEKLNRMTPKEREEWLEDGSSDELP